MTPERSKDPARTEAAKAFLRRFVGRGWLHATRENPDEQYAVNLGLTKRWLRRELGEAHFTPAGRIALSASPASPA